MKAMSIGSFDAKTHFSELLQDVEKGKSFEIMRRGKPVARLLGIQVGVRPRGGREALDFFRVLRHDRVVSRADVRSWISKGRP